MYAWPMDTDNSVVMAGGKGVGGTGAIFNSVNSKNKVKKTLYIKNYHDTSDVILERNSQP